MTDQTKTNQPTNPHKEPIYTDAKTWDELMAMSRDEFRAYFGFGPDTPPVTINVKYLPPLSEVKLKPVEPVEPKKKRTRRSSK